ncbi:hypothetical protein F5884DRAFT_882836 [Xylogone sp. PMI_703]|nr:hypothetical protein F5884DRAFT_882836 [Xylogone sp. PMI_703]
MSTDVKQTGEPPGSTSAESLAPGQTSSEQPRCYNCGLEGHYVMGCPEPTRAIPAGLAAARAAGASHPAKKDSSNDGRPFQQGQSSHRQRSGAIVTRYPVPKSAPVITRYAVPPHVSPGYAGSQGPYQQPYQQYGGFNQPPAYQGPHVPPNPYGPYPPGQQYSGAGPQFQYGQAQGAQPYGNQPPAYGTPGYQGPPAPYSQYPQPGQQGYPNTPEPYGPQPPVGPYQTPGAPYQHPNPSYTGGYGYNSTANAQHQNPPQWNQPPPSQPYNGPPYQNPPPPQYGQGYQNHPQPPYQSYGPQFQQPPQQGYGQGSQLPPYGGPHIPAQHDRPKSAGSSRSSSVGHERTSRRPFFKRKDGGSSGHQNHQRYGTQPPTDFQNEYSDDQSYFDWEFEAIFNEEIHAPAVPIALTLSNVPEEQPLYLGMENSDNIVSRYIRVDNLEEFKLSIRDTSYWDSVKDDTAFIDISSSQVLIPFEQVQWWMEERHARRAEDEFGTTQSRMADESTGDTDSYENNLKRARSPEKQLSNSPKRRRSEREYSPMQKVKYENESSPHGYRQPSPDVWASTTPVLNRSSTPALVAEDDAWAPQPGEGLASQTTAKDPTEALLASLGVSGEPKPVRDTSVNPLVDPYDNTRGPPPQRQDSGYFSSRGSYSNGSSSDGLMTRRASQWEGQPPPPPPPRDFLKRIDGTGDTPSPTTISPLEAMQQSKAGESSEYIAKDIHQAQKRSDGKKPEPLRQEDDVTPRFKRSQPQVAEAYRYVSKVSFSIILDHKKLTGFPLAGAGRALYVHSPKPSILEHTFF